MFLSEVLESLSTNLFFSLQMFPSVKVTSGRCESGSGIKTLHKALFKALTSYCRQTSKTHCLNMSQWCVLGKKFYLRTSQWSVPVFRAPSTALQSLFILKQLFFQRDGHVFFRLEGCGEILEFPGLFVSFTQLLRSYLITVPLSE